MWAAFTDGVPVNRLHLVAEALDQPWAPVRATWGATPQQRREQEAMMAMAGGPAPKRR